jgi:hypothetical protein
LPRSVTTERANPRRWTSRRALVLHLLVILWVPTCAIACWWQITVALAGDALGWLYSVEWPAFGLFGFIVWWNLIHDEPALVGSRALQRIRIDRHPHLATSGATERRRDDEDAALAAYNDYLENLARAEETKGAPQP